jgi:hypothetical protein
MFVICSITNQPRRLQHFVAPDAEGLAFNDNAFDQCALDEIGCDRWVDCIELDVGGAVSMSVQLGPAGGQFLAYSEYPPQ